MLLEDFLFAIPNRDRTHSVGAGVLIAGDRVLTCSHVVNAALGRNPNSTDRPDIRFPLKFHSRPELEIEAWVDEGLDAWNPPPASSKPGADLCLLRLSQNLKGSTAQVWIFDNLIRREFRAAGFPSDWRGDVDVAIGEIVGRDAHGLYLLRPTQDALAVLSTQGKSRLWSGDQRATGIIYSGFSGSPVEVDGKIAGLISEARAAASQATAYMIPAALFPSSVLKESVSQLPVIQQGDFPSERPERAAENRPKYSTDEGSPDFVGQFAKGPMVKETFLITNCLVESYAARAKSPSEADAILGTANRRRLSADPTEKREAVPIIQRYQLPLIDAGPVPFWYECFTRAFVMGPRMLASLLVAVADEMFDDQARRDRSEIMHLLGSRYMFKSPSPDDLTKRKT